MPGFFILTMDLAPLIQTARVTNLAVQHFDAEKAFLNAVFQVAAGGGFAQFCFADHVVYRETALSLCFAKQALDQLQRILLDTFTARIQRGVARLAARKAYRRSADPPPSTRAAAG